MIKYAAIKLATGKIITGRKHCEIIFEAVKAGLEIDNLTEGFMTDKDEFLDRFEAGQHAFICGQTKKIKAQLQSIDIEWPEDETPTTGSKEA